MKTKEFLKSARMFFIGFLGAISLVLMVSEPTNEESWFCVFLISKVLACLIALLCVFLLEYWGGKRLLPDDDKSK